VEVVILSSGYGGGGGPKPVDIFPCAVMQPNEKMVARSQG